MSPTFPLTSHPTSGSDLASDLIAEVVGVEVDHG